MFFNFSLNMKNSDDYKFKTYLHYQVTPIGAKHL